LCHELAAEGKYLDASPLKPISRAKSQRVRDGKTLVTDGPFAETYEQLGGYFLIDVENEQAALEVAARIPPAHLSTVEIRPLAELSGLPRHGTFDPDAL
jgi:hypothetical protein